MKSTLPSSSTKAASIPSQPLLRMLKSARVLAKVQSVPTKCLTLMRVVEKEAARMILRPHFRCK